MTTDLERITYFKSRTSILAAAFCILAFLCGLEGGIAYLREPFNALRLLPGESVKLTGPLAPGASSTEHMTYESDSENVSILFEEIISGYWLGGKMWRGTIKIDPTLGPGQYVLAVFGKEDQKKVGSNVFQLFVYRDRADYLADSKSLLLKYTGTAAWIYVVGFSVVVLLCCGLLYFLSGKRDRLMAEIGEAEVYHVIRDENGFSVYFGLGERNGIRKGCKLVLMDGNGREVQEVVVEESSETDAYARVGPLVVVRPGYLVRKL